MNAIITGASKGLGKAIANAFGALGYNLYLCSRSEHTLYKTVEELYNQFPAIKVKAIPADLSSKAGCDAFSKFVLSSASTIDILVNNTGNFVPGSVYNEPEGQLEEMIKTNLYSAYHVTRSLIGKMIEQKSGHIFNICSIASVAAYANGGSYSISKYAMLGFGKNLREEMKPFNVKVTNVLPGAALTDSWAGSNIDPKRIMEADDVAKMLVAATQLSPQACVEDILLRPQLGDL
ncbi:SDR family oxidoreductase [soil metagenome]